MLYPEVVFPLTSRLHSPFTALSLTLCPYPPLIPYPSTTPSCNVNPEAAFLDVIGAKVLRVFLRAIHNHLYYRILLHPPPEQKWFETVL
jgi:hypothetical protein